MPHILQIFLASGDDTFQLGYLLGTHISLPSLIALSGDLGAGKTHLTQGIAVGMGVLDPVTSPTFTLINEYESPRGKLCHMDVYRLSEPEALLDLGVEEYLAAPDTLTVIEWADRVQHCLPADRISIHLEHTDPGRLARLEFQNGDTMLTKEVTHVFDE